MKVTQSCRTLCDPMDCIVHGIFQARILEWVAFLFFRGSSQPRDQTQVPCIAGDSVPAEPQGKPKNTGVGTLYLLQGIFLTQESNQGLLHCRWIPYQVSHQGRNSNDPAFYTLVPQWIVNGAQIPWSQTLRSIPVLIISVKLVNIWALDTIVSLYITR